VFPEVDGTVSQTLRMKRGTTLFPVSTEPMPVPAAVFPVSSRPETQKPRKLMKPRRILVHRACPLLSGFATAVLLVTVSPGVTWDGATAPFNDAPSWDTDLVPVAGETAVLANGGTIQIPAGVTAPLTGGLGTFTVTSGTLAVSGGTLTMTGTISNGATGVTQVSGGTVTGSILGASGIATNGGLATTAGGTWSITGGTVNLNGVSAGNGGSQTIAGNVSAQDLRNTGGSTITFSGGTSTLGKVTAGSSGSGTLIVSDNAVVNQNISGQAASGSNNEFWIGNNASTGSVTLKDNAQWNYTFYNANSSINIGRGAGSHVFTIQDSASFTTQGGAGAGILRAVQVAAADGASRGTVNLNGGTVTVLGFNKGSGAGVINANGSRIKAAGGTTNFFSGFTGSGGAANNSNSVNVLAGGLKFDTNTFDAAITNVLSGPGSLEKLGAGALTLSGANTYAGETRVTEGLITFNSAFLVLNPASKLVVAEGAMVNLAHNIEDVVDVLQLGTTVINSGTWGSSSSAAVNQNDQFFTGNGVIRVGDPVAGRDLKWTAATSTFWDNRVDIEDENFNDPLGSSVQFANNDNATFDDTAADDEVAGNIVLLTDQVQAGVVTFDATEEYRIDGLNSGISGGASIVKNNTGTLILGGQTSNFTGPIAVNGGLVRMGDSAAFGSNSGITIASGAQVDINGKTPGPIHSYTIAGSGTDGSGAIVNTNATAIFSLGGVKNLTLSADATIGGNGRFDIASGGTITGNGHTLTKAGPNDMAFRGNASGTPIHYVIAAGSAWTENSALGFGGATGTITVKSGARAGNVGDFTIATPVTLESGGRLYTNGGIGTWTGAVTVQGDVTFEGLPATGGGIVVNGPVSGTANVTKIGPAPVTFGASAFPGNGGYDGNTTVSQGTLTLGAPALADSKDVTVATGAVLNLAYTGQDTVHILTLAGLPVVAGVWGREGSGTEHESALITGNGTLNVTTTGTLPPFETWAAGLPAGQRDRASDPDADGFSNLEEYLFGTDPAVSTGSLVQATRSGANLVLVWNQRNSNATYQLQERTADLELAWPASAVPVADAADQGGVPSNYTRKEAQVPIDTARKFVRVNGTES